MYLSYTYNNKSKDSKIVKIDCSSKYIDIHILDFIAYIVETIVNSMKIYRPMSPVNTFLV